MAHIICVIGNKGGTGKTTISHMISHGLGLLGKRTVCVLTDITREKLSKEGRKYLPFDARSPENLEKVIKTISNVPDWFGIIDGGGNRPITDRILASPSDLIILPFRDSHEDIRTVVADLERFPSAYALPSQWPTNQWARESAKHSVAELMAQYQSRILNPIPTLSVTKLLLQSELPAKLPPALNQACKHLAMQLFGLLDVDLRDTEIHSEQSAQSVLNKQEVACN